MTYNAAGQLLKRILPAYTPPGASSPVGGESTRAYSTAGDLVAQTDERGLTTRFSYDIAGNQTRSEVDVPGGGVRATVSAYDVTGNIRAITDPRGKTTGWTRDKLGRVIWKAEIGLEESCCIDGAVYVIGATDYDDAGNVTDQWDNGIQARNGAHTRFEYNGAGEVTASWAPLESKPTRFIRDFAGRITKQVGPDGVSIETTYDLAGRAISSSRVAVDGTRHTESYTMDAAGRRTGLTRANGQTQSWRYDYAGNVLGLTESLSDTTSRSVEQDYDLSGNKVRTVDARGNATWNVFNTRNQLEKVVEPVTSATPALADRSWTFSYDAGGLRTREVAPGGVIRNNRFDSLGQLTSYVGHDPNSANASVNRAIEYSNAGNITRITTPGASQNYTWGSWGQLLTARGPVSDVDYAYDDALRLERKSEKVAGVTLSSEYTDRTNYTSYTYDSAGRTVGVSAAAFKRTVITERRFNEQTGRPADETYRSDNVVSNWQPGVTGTRKYLYDSFGRVQDDVIYDPKGAELARTTFTYDAVDNITKKSVSGQGGDTGGSYTYDLASRLTGWQPSSATSENGVSYTWDGTNNRLTEKATTSAREWQYDQRDRPTSVSTTASDSTSSVSISSNPRGDITSIGSRALVYNAFDELISDSATTYEYDALGRMVTRGDQNILYSGLDNQPVATVGGTGLREFVAPGIDGAGGATFDLSTKAVAHLLANSHDDTTTRLEWAGGLAATSRRDPFGAPVSPNQQLQASTYSGYQGDWTDPSSGTVRMGVRWYEPSLGRFLTRDTATLPVVHGGATNRFTYADANPTNITDSTGHVGVAPPPPMIDVNEFWRIVGPSNAWGARVLNDVYLSAARTAAGAETAALARAAVGVAAESGLGAGLGILRFGWGGWLLLGAVLVATAVILAVDTFTPKKPEPQHIDEYDYQDVRFWRDRFVRDPSPVRTVSEVGGKRIVTDTVWGSHYRDWLSYTVTTHTFSYSSYPTGSTAIGADTQTVFNGGMTEFLGRLILGQTVFTHEISSPLVVRGDPPVDPSRAGVSLTGEAWLLDRHLSGRVRTPPSYPDQQLVAWAERSPRVRSQQPRPGATTSRRPPLCVP